LAPILAAAACALLLSACSPGPNDLLVPFEELTDSSEPLADGLGGVDLGGLAPDSATFCEAAGTAPVRWITDAAIPLQYWIDSFATAQGIPAEAEGAVARLRDFAAEPMAWQLGNRDKRPLWEEPQTQDAMLLADAAISNCPDLPLAVGLPGASATPLAWRDLDEIAIAERCADNKARVENAVIEFTEKFRIQPRHQIEMEPVLSTFYASDWHGVTVGDNRVATVVPIPSGACDHG
jgi:hypothetical protein